MKHRSLGAACAALIVGAIAPHSSSVHAAEVPAQAQPGAMQPRDIREAELPEAPAVTFPIPPAYERPFGEEEGDRVFVNRFIITGIVDDPARGVSAAEVDALVQERFAAVMDIAEAERRERQQLDAVVQRSVEPRGRALRLRDALLQPSGLLRQSGRDAVAITVKSVSARKS